MYIYIYLSSNLSNAVLDFALGHDTTEFDSNGLGLGYSQPRKETQCWVRSDIFLANQMTIMLITPTHTYIYIYSVHSKIWRSANTTYQTVGPKSDSRPRHSSYKTWTYYQQDHHYVFLSIIRFVLSGWNQHIRIRRCCTKICRRLLFVYYTKYKIEKDPFVRVDRTSIDARQARLAFQIYAGRVL